MYPTRLALGAALIAAAVYTAPAVAQGPEDSVKNHRADAIDADVQHWHFDGRISTVNPGSRQITINADSIPMQLGGQTTLPYAVPASENFEQYKVGDWVNADLVVRANRTLIENVKPGKTDPSLKAKYDEQNKKYKEGAKGGAAPKDANQKELIDNSGKDKDKGMKDSTMKKDSAKY